MNVENSSKRKEQDEGEDFRFPNVLAAESASDFWNAADAVELPENSWREWLSEVFAGFGPFEWVTYAYLAWLEAIVVDRKSVV